MRHFRLVVAVVVTIAGLVAAPVAFAQTVETGAITVWVFDDRGTPSDTSDDVPTSSWVRISGDSGSGTTDGAVITAEGESTADDPFVAAGLDAGSYWIEVAAPAHAYEEPLLVELNTDPTLDCHVGDASTPGCVAGDGDTIVSVGLGPSDTVRRISVGVLDDDGADQGGGTFEVRRDDGDGLLDTAADPSVFGPQENEEGVVTDQLEPGSYWVVEVRPPDGFGSHGPVLVHLNLDPTMDCVAGDLEFWGDGPRCQEGQGYTSVVFWYHIPPSATERPALTAPPTDAHDESVPEPGERRVPWLALTGLALTSLLVLLAPRRRRNGPE